MGNVTRSNQNNITSPQGNSLAVFVEGDSGCMKVKDVMGNIQPISDFVGGGGGGTSVVQAGVGAYSTLRVNNGNTANGYASTVIGGRFNQANGYASSILGGLNNTVNGFASSVLAGYNNTNNCQNSHIIGGNIQANRNNTTFVNDMTIVSMACCNGCSVGVGANGLLVPVSGGGGSSPMVVGCGACNCDVDSAPVESMALVAEVVVALKLPCRKVLCFGGGELRRVFICTCCCCNFC